MGLHPDGMREANAPSPGAMLSEEPKEGEGLKIIGSALIAHAASKEEVLEMVKSDIYSEAGVWDLEKASWNPAPRV